MFGISVHSQILHWGPTELSDCAGPTRVYYGILWYSITLLLLQRRVDIRDTMSNNCFLQHESPLKIQPTTNRVMATARSTSQDPATQAHIAQRLSLSEETF